MFYLDGAIRPLMLMVMVILLQCCRSVAKTRQDGDSGRRQDEQRCIRKLNGIRKSSHKRKALIPIVPVQSRVSSPCPLSPFMVGVNQNTLAGISKFKTDRLCKNPFHRIA